MKTFSRQQLIERDYDPFEDMTAEEGAGVIISHAEYLREHGLGAIDHIAAVRGVLIQIEGGYYEPDGDDPYGGGYVDDRWEWIWDWGKLHDEIAKEHRVKAWGRYRNQRGMLPRVEFEPGADVSQALRLLIKAGIRGTDVVHIEVMGSGLVCATIDEYFGGV